MKRVNNSPNFLNEKYHSYYCFGIDGPEERKTNLMYLNHKASMKNDYSDYPSASNSEYSSFPSSASSATSKNSSILKRKSNLGFAGNSIMNTPDISTSSKFGTDNAFNKYPRPSAYNETNAVKFNDADAYKFSNVAPIKEESKLSPTGDYWNNYSNNRFTNENRKQDNEATISKFRAGRLNETITSQKAIRDVSDYNSKYNDRSVYSRERIDKPTVVEYRFDLFYGI